MSCPSFPVALNPVPKADRLFCVIWVTGGQHAVDTSVCQRGCLRNVLITGEQLSVCHLQPILVCPAFILPAGIAALSMTVVNLSTEWLRAVCGPV